MKNFKYIIVAVLIATLGSACTSEFDDMNTNPNSPEKWNIGPAGIIEELIYSSADGFLDRTKAWNGELMQYTVSSTTLNAYHRYSIANGIMSSSWNHMAQWASNADHMYKLAVYKDGGNKTPVYENSKGIALTMKALMLSNLTDVFGDVPCSEAFRSDGFVYDESLLEKDPNYYTPISKPKFDTQKEVYEYLLSILEEANGLYTINDELTKKTFESKDLLYKADMLKWKKFTNSLHLRLLMRLSNRDQEMGISARINKILSDPDTYPVFESNEDNAALRYSGVSPFDNRYGSQTESSFQDDRKAADNMISIMAGDPRLELYFVKGKGDWLGLVSGEASPGESDGVAKLNKNSVGLFTSPYAFMKYDEVLFIAAEAAKRGFIAGGNAKTKEYFGNAIRASIDWWYSVEASGKFEPDEEVINKFVEEKARTNSTLEEILNQKYVALFWVGYEAWHEYRRTGFPQLKIGSATHANNFILPTRFAYPINTAKVNPVNYAEAVDRLRSQYKGEDNMQAPVWWSKMAAGN